MSGCGRGSVPETLGLVVQGARVAAGSGLVQLGQQGLASLLAGVVGELDSDGFSGTQGLLPIQAFDGLLCLVSLVKPDEAHSSRYACSGSENRPMLVPGGARSDSLADSTLPVTWAWPGLLRI